MREFEMIPGYDGAALTQDVVPRRAVCSSKHRAVQSAKAGIAFKGMLVAALA